MQNIQNMPDDEMERAWKSNGRPQSTMARSFSLALNDLFKIDNSLADLDAAVDQKKRAVSTQTSELEALEARIKATEERLKLSQSTGPNRASLSPRYRVPLGETFGAQPQAQKEVQTATSADTESRPKTPTRPLSARRPVPGRTAPPIPGALPPTPGASEDGEDESAKQAGA